MERHIVNENPKYPPVKLIEPTTRGYIGVCPYLEPKAGIARKRRPIVFALREKSGETAF
jgi:hypothetical protein